MPDPVVIVDYDPAWPERFNALAARAAAVLGDCCLGIVNHITRAAT